MKNNSESLEPHNVLAPKARHLLWAVWPLMLIAACLLAGCQQELYKPAPSPASFLPQSVRTNEVATKSPELVILREGNVVKVSFPGSPTLDTVQQIRSDGKIALPLVGEVDAAGMTPPALQKKLLELYAPQLSTKQVSVELQNSSFPIYVTGMVQHPGKILSDHPMTVLEAVMEAGGFDYTKADTKDVTVIRREQEVMKSYKVNLKAVLKGEKTEPFFLKPNDIVYVPERFTIF